MTTLKRMIRNWLGVTGDAAYPHRFIAFTTWHDRIIAVDGNGDIYELYEDYRRQPMTQLMMKNPLEK